MKRVALILALFLLLTDSAKVAAAGRVQPVSDKTVIVIDPGHGGENEGTIENGFLEKSMTLVTAMAMYEDLIQYDDVEVYLTRTDDRDMSLKERAEFAASVNADFLFSIHYNASVDHDLFGSEVWIPSAAPFNAYGFQFGYTQMLTMQDMGLFLRGVKSKKNDRGTDYYGIIRESAELNLPAVIIEHCHVDEKRDYPFCDTEEELIAFGKADALSVAKYFGLKSDILGVDYSSYSAQNLPYAEQYGLEASTLTDETPPDICEIGTVGEIDENGFVTLSVTAADYDSPLIYYDYSLDGGVTYSPLQAWPGSDVLKGTYTDSFQLNIELPIGQTPLIVLRAYNQFDGCTESRLLSLPVFEPVVEENTEEVITPEVSKEEPASQPGKTKHFFRIPTMASQDSDQVSIVDFLFLCLILVTLLFLTLLISRIITANKKRKRRRQRRNVSGKNNRQPK